MSNYQPDSKSLIQQIRVIISLLDPRTRHQLIYVVFAALGLGLLECASIGLFLPAFQAIVDPSAGERIGRLIGLDIDSIAAGVGGSSVVFPILIAAVMAVFLIKNALQFVVIKRMNRFIFAKQAAFIGRLFNTYLRKDYPFHQGRNTAVAMRNLTVSAGAVFSSGLLPILNLLIETIMVIGIGTVLFLVEPLVTTLIGLIIGGLGILAHRFMAPRFSGWGGDIHQYTMQMIKWVNETLGSIKAVKVSGREEFFVTRFAAVVEQRCTAESEVATFVHLPRLMVESVIIGLLGTVIIFLFWRNVDLVAIVPVLGIYGIAVMRLLPSLNRILNQAAQIKVGVAAVDSVHEDLFDLLEK
ncbi:MAG: hypothetical protein HKN28_04265, partial [Alphaproteobacteria bacterium]|nr:hypothetical protein [Alphaproteobacteria bacterium]